MKFSDDLYRKIFIRKEAEKNNNYMGEDNKIEKRILNILEDNMIIVNSIWNVDYDFTIRSHRKVIGKLIIFAKKVLRKLLKWYVRDTGIEQNRFNSYSVKVMNGIWDYINELNVDNSKLKEKVNQLNTENIVLKENMELLKANTSNLENKVTLLEKIVNEDFCDMKSKILKSDEETLRVKHMLKKFINKDNINEELDNELVDNFIDDKIDYFDFENKFRGLESDVIKKQEVYLPYFKESNKLILDIGCGRGEFLSMLTQNNILCKGVDVYPEFVKYCRSRGLDVVLDDAVSFLNRLEDNSLGGVFIGQVVEHLDTSYIIKLFSLCLSKLCEGGKIIVETQNPETLGVLGEAFYIDPSHIKPIHPLQLKYLAESTGFKNIETLYLNEFEEKIPYPIGVDNEEEVNNAIDRINKLLYGARDYSIIGEK